VKKEAAAEQSYGETLDYLFGLQRFGIKLGLENITALLGLMGNPHRAFPALHIAGSNGKGSTAAFLDSILRRSGLRTGLYTSPHLVDFSERIRVDGKAIPTERIVALTRGIRARAEEMERQGFFRPEGAKAGGFGGKEPGKATLTFFEFTTAMMFQYFREEKVDLAVVEAGLGGRLDATNVVDPVASLITTISREHAQYLGGTLLKIAGEKAGIIKPGRPLLSAAAQPKIAAFFEKRCAEGKSPFRVWGRDFEAREEEPGIIHFRGRRRDYAHLRLGLAGAHQKKNAGLALAAVEVLQEAGFPIEEAHIRGGLAETRWPGRLELIRNRTRILLDGAHNPEATAALRKALEKGFPRRRLILILGIMADKDIPAMMKDLVPLADLLFLTRAGNERAATLDLLEAESSPYEKPGRKFVSVGEAVEEGLNQAEKEDLILVAGSLYIVGEARAYLLKRGIISL
jgi:dihydrofolate synthase / folylpolyglutamate synthase